MNRILTLSALSLLLSIQSYVWTAEAIKIYANTSISQIEFAVTDLTRSLKEKGLAVEVVDLKSLGKGVAGRQIVFGTRDDKELLHAFAAAGGQAKVEQLGEQAYTLRTTTKGKEGHWIIAGDANGAMYGGLDLAEDIQLNGLKKTYQKDVAPHLLRRGAKLNLSFDKRTPTYSGSFKHTSSRLSVRAVWSMEFWTKWIDEQVRNRNNVLTVWVHNPFPALVEVPTYEKGTLPSIEDDSKDWKDGAQLTLPKRIAFWRGVIKYAQDRGFKFYFFNWNVCPDYVEDQYPQVTDSQTNDATIDYYQKAIKALFATYPELNGFGISIGDAMDGTKDENANWSWRAYGQAILEFAQENPTKNINIIVRMLKADPAHVTKYWDPVIKQPNITFDCSIKFCQAHVYSTPNPRWVDYQLEVLMKSGLSTWTTLRNDGLLYLDFGNTQFVRELLKTLPPQHYQEGEFAGKPLNRGYYLGHDTYSPTYSYLYKNPAFNFVDGTKTPMMEIQRKWYMEAMWGRLSYDINISDQLLKSQISRRFPNIDTNKVFDSWAKASGSICKVMEMVQGSWHIDWKFYTEAGVWQNIPERKTQLRRLSEYCDTQVAKGSEEKLASIPETALNKVGAKKSALTLADEIEADCTEALKYMHPLSQSSDTRTSLLAKNIMQQAALGIHYAHVFRAAVALKAGDKERARDAFGRSYGWWILYSNMMDDLYFPDRFRSYNIQDGGWHGFDSERLKDFHDLGGTGTPPTATIPGL
jgi:hypothetical protein